MGTEDGLHQVSGWTRQERIVETGGQADNTEQPRSQQSRERQKSFPRSLRTRKIWCMDVIWRAMDE